MRRVISTEDAPAAIGPYSQAIAVPPGTMVFCSGQIGLDPATGNLVEGGVEAEAVRALDNLAAVLAAAGGAMAHIVRATIYLADFSDYGKVNAIYARYFADSPPARAAVGVSALPKGARIEIDAIAVIPS